MKLYRYESTEHTGDWTESLGRANKEYENEKEYLMANGPDEDDTVKLVSIVVPDDLLSDELIDFLEDEYKELKTAMLIHDPDRVNESPREDGYDFDYYCAWSDDVAKRSDKEME